MNTLFKEKQKFKQRWLWLILIGLGALSVYGVLQQVFVGKDFGSKPMSDIGIIIFCLGIFGFIYFFWYMTLITEISRDGIKMRFIPFVKKEMKWNEVKSIKIVNYGFIGHGIRFGSEHGTVYNMKGNKGLAVKLHNGHQFVIGTQKENELRNIIKKLKISD